MADTASPDKQEKMGFFRRLSLRMKKGTEKGTKSFKDPSIADSTSTSSSGDNFDALKRASMSSNSDSTSSSSANTRLSVSSSKNLSASSSSSSVEMPSQLRSSLSGSNAAADAVMKDAKREKKEREKREKEDKEREKEAKRKEKEDKKAASLSAKTGKKFLNSSNRSSMMAIEPEAETPIASGAATAHHPPPPTLTRNGSSVSASSTGAGKAKAGADAPPPPPVSPRPDMLMQTRHQQPADKPNMVQSVTRTVYPSIEVVQVVEDDALYATLDDLRRLAQAKGATVSQHDDDGMYISLHEIRNLHQALRKGEEGDAAAGGGAAGMLQVSADQAEDMYLSFSELRATVQQSKEQEGRARGSSVAVSGSSKGEDKTNDILRELLKGSMSNIAEVLEKKSSSPSLVAPAAAPETAAPAADTDNAAQVNAPNAGGLAPPTISVSGDASSSPARSATSSTNALASSKNPIEGGDGEPVSKKIRVKLSFNCDICKNPLTSAFYLKDGMRYCANDYRTNFGVRCGKCNLYIEGSSITAGGKNFHSTCLSCASCNKTLTPGEKLLSKDDKLFCEPCGNRQSTLTEMCGFCNQPLFGEAIKAMGCIFHPNCFCCAECKSPLTAQFYEKEGKAYCEKDYKRLFTRSCAGCGLEILPGQSFQVGDMYFHMTCMICELCSKSIENGQPIFIRGNKPCHCDCMCCCKCGKVFGGGDTIFSAEGSKDMYCGDCAGVTPAPSPAAAPPGSEITVQS